MQHSPDDAGGQGAEATPQAAEDPIICYACETELPEGRRHCPGCGRSQLRTCYCGNDIPVTAIQCPYCGADWSQSARVQRRKSRSRRVRPVQLLTHALGGALMAVVLVILLNLALEGLAGGSLAPGETMPASPAERFGLAAHTIAAALSASWQFIARHVRPLLGLLVLAAAGAAAGVLYYLARAGRHRHNRIKRTSGQSRNVVRVRRRRV